MIQVWELTMKSESFSSRAPIRRWCVSWDFHLVMPGLESAMGWVLSSDVVCRCFLMTLVSVGVYQFVAGGCALGTVEKR